MTLHPPPPDKLQQIYKLALKRPREGYALSPLFKPAPFKCPRCSGKVYVRNRRNSSTAIGAICCQCSWTATHVQRPDLPPAPPQSELF